MTKQEAAVIDEVLSLLPKSAIDLAVARRYGSADLDGEWERIKLVREKLQGLKGGTS